MGGVLDVDACVAAPLAASDRIRLSEDMLINLSGQRPAVELVDEQDLAGDPRKGDAQQPKTVYSNGWINAKLYYPIPIVIDLGVVHDLTDICYFDAEDQGVLSIDYRDANAWKPLFSGPLSEYRQWTTRKVSVATRYLRLTFESPSSQVAEIMLYGTARGQRPPVPQAGQHPRAPMDSFIGVNGFIDDPVRPHRGLWASADTINGSGTRATRTHHIRVIPTTSWPGAQAGSAVPAGAGTSTGSISN